MNILCPIASGSGASVLHGQIRDALPGYRLKIFSPAWEYFPLALPYLGYGKCDLIHAPSDYGFFYRRAGVPLVVTAHNYVSDSVMRSYSTWWQYLHYRSDLRWFTRRTVMQADAVVAVSEFVRDALRYDLGCDRQIEVIYNGVDAKRFRPSRHKPKTARFRILYCGNLTLRKRAQLLGPLAARLGKRFEIRYTAGLPLGGANARLVEPGAQGLLVNLGRIKYADMPSLYQDVDALFMPSAREGFGLCVAEAMACGLPVVASDASALPELVVEGLGGQLCGIDDIEAFAAAFEALAGDPPRCVDMGQFNRQRVEENFTLERMAANYKSLFERVLDKR